MRGTERGRDFSDRVCQRLNADQQHVDCGTCISQATTPGWDDECFGECRRRQYKVVAADGRQGAHRPSMECVGGIEVGDDDARVEDNQRHSSR